MHKNISWKNAISVYVPVHVFSLDISEFFVLQFSKCEDFKDLGRLAWISGIATTAIHLSGIVEKLRNSISWSDEYSKGLVQILHGKCTYLYWDHIKIIVWIDCNDYINI